MPPSKREPLVSIVTPSLNSGKFLERTILSVLAQDYPHIEYVVMDGGSSDETLQILERFDARLLYVSERDLGQADAVNRGVHRTHGDIVGFLNADDVYEPDAVRAIVQAFADRPDAGVVYGDAWYVSEQGERIGPYPVEPFKRETLARRCIICQPAAFVRRQAFESAGLLDASLRFAHDYDLWIRMAERSELVKIDRVLASSRLHDAAKTMRYTAAAMRETVGVLYKHYQYVPFNWLYGYAYQRITGKPLAMEKPLPHARSLIYSIGLACRFNWRSPVRSWRDIIRTAVESRSIVPF
jgi:glycosyltransferase involved in cell wall biosynthesis